MSGTGALRRCLVGAMLTALAAAAPAQAAPAPPAPAARQLTLSVPVSFAVDNVNRSALSCESDGQRYVLAGRLVGPRRALERTGGSVAATLYLHELNFGRFFWNLRSRPAYDYALRMARLGHVSVVLDRLGYGKSPHPDGNAVCVGSQADMTHQAIDQLREGTYVARRIAPRPFDRIVLAGHSVGGAIAELETYSFADADALMLFAWADQGFTAPAIQETFEQGADCAHGGEPWAPGGAGGYAYLGQNEEEFRAIYFHSAPDSIVERVTALRQRDPCGDVNSITPGILLNNDRVDEVAVPVLLLYGLADFVFDQPGAGEDQAESFTGTDDVTTAFFEETAHALTFERAIPEIRQTVHDWLAQRGFAYADRQK